MIITKTQLAFLAIFSIVIMNFGPIPLSFSILASFFCVFSINNYSNSRGRGRGRGLSSLLFALKIPLLFMVLSCITAIYYINNVKIVMYFAIYIYITLCVIFVMYFLHCSNVILAKALSIFIYISFFSIISQHVVYFLFGIYLDYHAFLTIFRAESRYFSPLLNSFGLCRPTGWAVEPSNMSAIMVFISVIYYFVKTKCSDSGVDKTFWLGMASSLATFSFAGIIITVAIILVVSLKSISRKKIVLFVSPIMASFIYLVWYRMTAGVGYDSLAMRQIIVGVIIEQPLENLVFGNGFFALSLPLSIGDYLVFDYNIRDSGLWVNLIFSIGIIPTSLVLFTVAIFSRSVTNTLIIILALSSKFDYFQPFFWLFVIYLIWYFVNENKIRKSKSISC